MDEKESGNSSAETPNSNNEQRTSNNESIVSDSQGALYALKKVAPYMRKAVSFAKGHAVLLALLLVVVLQFLPNGSGTYPWGGLHMRMLTQDLPFADATAGSSVDNFLRQQATVLAGQQYPNLPDANRARVIDDLVKKLRSEAGVQFESEKSRLTSEIKKHFQYESDGVTYNYMPDIDPYFYLRLARNIVEKGQVYDELRNGEAWDNHMYAPVGLPVDPSWHPHVMAALYFVFSVFDKNITVMEAANYLPIVFMFLSIILAFLVANRVSGPLGGFFAATALAVLPAITGRTLFGHADTDIYQVFFPLLVVWLLCEGLAAKSWKAQGVFALLTGFSIALYTRFWSGWWYLFDFILAALAVAFVLELFLHVRKQNIRQALHNFHLRKFLVIGGVFFAACLLFGWLFIGLGPFLESGFQGAISFTSIKNAARPDLWPNVYTTVAELNPSRFDDVVASVGGTLMFGIALLGLVLLLMRVDEHGKFDVTYTVLLSLWFLGTTYASLKGVRFILLIGPAFAVAFGSAAGLLYQRLGGFGERQLHISKQLTGALLIVLLGLAIIGPVQAGPHMVKVSFAESTRDVPIVNDAWWNVMTQIKDKSTPDAIVNSWWDFGHHFKYISDRAVTFDGSTQNSPQAHWIGRALQTSSEQEAVGILRMLDCGANNAFDAVFNVTQDHYRSVQIVEELIMLDKESARKVAKREGVPENVLLFTHCDAPEDFFITSADMVGKAGVWSHFGMWDFERAEVWIKWKDLPEGDAVPQMAKRFNWTEEYAGEIYNHAVGIGSEEEANQWISPWNGYIGEPASCGPDAGLLRCGSVAINASGKSALIQVSQGLASAGELVAYDKKGNVSRTKLNGGNAGLVVLMWPRGREMVAMPAVKDLSESMFTRLFYMNGLGLRNFRHFAEDNQLFGGKISVWKVDWNGLEPFVPEDLKPKTKVESGALLKVDYIGWTDNDRVFDSSIVNWQSLNVTSDTLLTSEVTKPLEFVFGEGKLIAGFERRIENMTAGQTRTIVVPPEEGYGVDPVAHPLGNKTLHFKVRLVSVQ